MKPPARVFTVQPSRRLLDLVLAGHGAAGLGVFWADLSPGVQMALGAALLASVAWLGWRRAPVTLRCHGDGRLEVQGGPDWHPAEVLPDSRVQGAWALLRWRSASAGTQAVWVLPDSLDADEFRRLRIWLKWRVRPGPHAYQPSRGR